MAVRAQPIYAKTGRSLNIILAVLLCAGLMVNIMRTTTVRLPWSKSIYIKPPLDKTATYGMPIKSSTEPFSYSQGELGNGINFNMATTLYRQKDGSIIVYLTNPVNSSTYLLCEIKDQNGRIVAKSGRVAPGKYVADLKPKSAWENEAMPITVFIYAMDLKEGYSLGSLEYETTLQPW